MAYATTTELAEYLGVEVADLPDDADRLLQRASELIDRYTLNRIDDSDTDHLDAAEMATKAQVEQWLELGDEGIVEIQGLTIGPFQAQFGAGQNRAMPEIANRARQALFLAGLWNKGVDVR